MAEFKSSHERDCHEKAERISDAFLTLPFGVPFLDATLGGIRRTDLIMIGATPGVGKTELAVEIALQACKKLKRVHFFALEAEDNEIERRMKFKVIAEAYFNDGGKEFISYQDWVLGRLGFLDKYEAVGSKEILTHQTLFTLYREGKFTIDDFSRHVLSLDGKSDLICVDHIHFFDHDSENENKAIADIVHQIRDLSLITKIPVILIAHLRKLSRQEKTLVPTLSDFHGTSELGKVATRTVVLSAGGFDGKSGLQITYMRAVKNRLGGDRCSAVAKMLYDPSRNSYTSDIKYGFLSDDEKEFIPFDLNKPQWLELS